MGFESPEAVREAILEKVSIDLLEPLAPNEYGDRYEAIITLTGASGTSRLVRTVWIVLFDEEIARFVTAVPERRNRQ